MRQITLALIGFCLVPSVSALAQGFDGPHITLSRLVDSGKETQLRFYWNINNDCTTQRGFTVSVERAPKHGEARLTKINLVIDENMIRNSRPEQHQETRRCLGRTIPVISLRYTSKRGYIGFDDLLARVQWSPGDISINDYRIGVKAP